MVWPAPSPELNYIENLRAVMDKDIYRYKKAYIRVTKLTTAICPEWNIL